jgi:hypothetical protein
MYVMILWPHFFNKQALLNELPIYAAFFSEKDVLDYDSRQYYGSPKISARKWIYNYTENSFLSCKTVFVYSHTEALLYDYSSLLTAEITNENLNDFENNYGIVIHDLTKENLSVSTIKEILANNAKAAIQAEKLVKQIDALKSINEDFED